MGEDTKEKIPRPLQEQLQKSMEAPPLFIKIDKYKDIIQNIQKLKSYSLSLRDALDALSDVEKEIQTCISIANKALDMFNTIISLLDTRLLRVHGLGEKTTVTVPKEMDEYVKDVYNEVERIKNELNAIRQSEIS
jgi:Mg2+ and Co2+ transporter CorA